MQSQFSLQTRNNTRDKSNASTFIQEFAPCVSPFIYDDLQKDLETLENDLPRQSNEIALLTRYLNTAAIFPFLTPAQKSCYALNLSANRKADKLTFTFYHAVKAYLSNYCEKTMQRANLQLEKRALLRKADRKKVAWDKTVNIYHKDKMLIPLRVVGDQIFINYIDDSGKKHFLPLLDFVKMRISDLKKLNENRKSFIEKNMVPQRQCPPNYNVLMNMYISTGRLAQMRQKTANSIYIEKKLSAGIRIPGTHKLLPIPEPDIQKFGWYDEHVTMDAIAVLENMKPKTFSKIRSPVAYMLVVCKNVTEGNISWKRPFPKLKNLMT